MENSRFNNLSMNCSHYLYSVLPLFLVPFDGLVTCQAAFALTIFLPFFSSLNMFVSIISSNEQTVVLYLGKCNCKDMYAFV